MKSSNPIRPVVIVERRKTYIPHLLAIGLIWVGVMTWDYHDQVAIERENAQRMSAAMVDCLNGTYRATASDGVQIGCMPAETLKPEERNSK